MKESKTKIFDIEAWRAKNKRQDIVRDVLWKLGWNKEGRELKSKFYNPLAFENSKFFKQGKIGNTEVVFALEVIDSHKIVMIGSIEMHKEKDPNNTFLYAAYKDSKEQGVYFAYPDIRFPFEFFDTIKYYPIEYKDLEELKELVNIDKLSTEYYIKEGSDNEELYAKTIEWH